MDSVFKIPKLKGSTNYDIWAIRIKALLTEKDFYHVFTVDIPQNTSEYQQASVKASAIIRLTLEDSPLVQTQYIEDANQLWNQLKTLYEPRGFSSEFLICRELFNTTLSKCNNSMEAYLTKIRRYTDQLMAKNLTIPAKVIAAYTLSNLTPEYEATVAIISQSLRTSTTDVDLLQLFGQLVDESRRVKYRDENTEMAMPLTKNKAKNDSKCAHCSKLGHTEEKCWKKYPELKKIRILAKNSQKQTRKPQLKDQYQDNDGELALTTWTNTLNQSIPTLKPTVNSETSRLLGLAVNDPGVWYLDSGATTHICANKALFSHLEPCNKTLNWGQIGTTTANGIGTVRLQFSSTGQVATISNCLYLPQIGLNLLSLGELLAKGVSLNSTQEGAILTIKNRVFARGAYHENLTYFRTSPQEKLLLASTANTWHDRMGHIGQKALSALPNKTLGCEITVKAMPEL